MKMKIWIEEAMKEMVEEVEKNEPMPKHWKRSVLRGRNLNCVS